MKRILSGTGIEDYRGYEIHEDLKEFSVIDPSGSTIYYGSTSYDCKQYIDELIEPSSSMSEAQLQNQYREYMSRELDPLIDIDTTYMKLYKYTGGIRVNGVDLTIDEVTNGEKCELYSKSYTIKQAKSRILYTLRSNYNLWGSTLVLLDDPIRVKIYK